MAGVDVNGIDDKFFAREKQEKSDDLFNPKVAKATATSADRKAAQTKVDAALLKNIGGAEMSSYLKAKFTLSKGDKPHLLKF